MMYTSKYFSLTETECRCGCGKDLTDRAKQDFDALREEFGGPLTMTSGARCASYNQKVSTTGPDGPHTSLEAADFGVSHGDAHKLLTIAVRRGYTGIGIQQKGSGRFIHLDRLTTPPRPNVWSY